MAGDIPELHYTPVEDIPNIAGSVRKTFHTHRTKAIEYRLVQLRKLYWGIHDNQETIAAACARDNGKPAFEAFLSEVGWVMNDIVFMQKNLEKWAKDESAADIALTNKFLSPRIRKEPLGCVLIIGPYNFPFQLTLGPLIGAISAGCTAVIKPSENAPAAAVVMQDIIAKHLDPTAYTTVQGGIPESTALLEQKWDKIFYTGNGTVAKIIAKRAAETLTPVTLELGGINPAIVTKKADPRLAARRLLWAKLLNAGQVCVSQNYTLVDKEILSQFVTELKKAIKEFYPEGTKNSKDYSKIINERQWQRLKKMLDDSKGRILIGGEMDEKDKFFDITVVQVEDVNDSLIVEESFGPLFPIYPVNDLDEAIRIANEVSDTSLGIYPFGDKKETMRVLNETRSGGATVNDGFFHASIPTLAFGGVGQSGQGAYRGKASFDCFTHRRSVVTTPAWLESMINIRYPPYSDKKLEKFKSMSYLKPNFDREGRTTVSWAWWVLGFGASSWSGATKRYLLLLLMTVVTKLYQQRQSKL